MNKDSCLFCKIIKKEIPAQIVFENDEVLAFKDIHPLAKVHYLFISKNHSEDVMSMMKEDSKNIEKIYQAIYDVAKKDQLDQQGFRVVCNTGAHGGQTVFHTHFHLLGGEPLGSFGASTR